MKRNYFLSIVLSLLTLCLMSCESSSLDTKNSATEPYFPEPCLAWGSDIATVKSKMLSLGYLLDCVESDEEECVMQFVYNNNLYCVCWFVNGKYLVSSRVVGLPASVAQNIDMNYSKRAKYLGMIVEDEYWTDWFETKDGKTLFCVVIYNFEDDAVIQYFSKNSESGKELYEELLEDLK